MELQEIAAKLSRQCRGNAQVTGITHDSRLVQPGDLYIAVPGLTQHGHEFVEQALANGAVAIATDEVGLSHVRAEVPAITLEAVRFEMGLIAAQLNGHPEKELDIVGITGTNGKTTTAFMVSHILEATDRKVGLIGTLGVRIGQTLIPGARTTPESTDLYRTFSQMHSAGATHVVMEVSSHALALDRVAGVQFRVAAFTNLTQDHLDFHSTMEEYFLAKAQLFKFADVAVINVDDEWGMRLANETPCPVVVRLGTNGNYEITSIEQSLSAGVKFSLRCPTGTLGVSIPMVGQFNAANAAMAIALCAELGISANESVAALQDFPGVPGRCERVPSSVAAIVDYAHTPDAVEKVLTAIRAASPNRIITVIGCGGDRDPSKRQAMGQAAGERSDVVVVTDDNPRSELPESIRKEVVTGANRTQSSVIEIADRREAIRYALEHAIAADVVVVLGKGHETGQEIAGVVYPFDDREVIRQESPHA